MGEEIPPASGLDARPHVVLRSGVPPTQAKFNWIREMFRSVALSWKIMVERVERGQHHGLKPEAARHGSSTDGRAGPASSARAFSLDVASFQDDVAAHF